MITGRVLAGPRNTYFYVAGRGFSSSDGGTSVDDIGSSVANSGKGSTW